jgi:cytochrome c2
MFSRGLTMLARIFIATAATAMLVGGTVHAADAAPGARHFANCTAMHRTYAHGVGRLHAHDHVTSGRPVTNFKHSNALYRANSGSDRDGDHVACEQH